MKPPYTTTLRSFDKRPQATARPQFEDNEHSLDEEREIIIGHSVKERLILICFTVLEERIRLISARKATRLERKDYEESVHP